MKKFIYIAVYLWLNLFLLEGVQAATSKTTTSDKAIVVAEHRVALIMAKEVMRVVEVFMIENKSDATLVGLEEKKTLRFALPEGFFAPQFIDETANVVSVTHQGFDYLNPVEPGELQLAVSYHLKISSLPYTFSIQTNYPTQVLNVFTDPSIQVVSDQLRSQPLVQMGEQQFRRYAGNDFNQGTVIPIQLTPASGPSLPNSGIPDSNASRVAPLPSEEFQDNQRQSLIVFIIVSILIIGGVLAAYSKSRLNKNKKASKPARMLKPSVKQEREALIRAIADLDDRFEAGDLAEEAYHKERARKKKKLMELTRAINQRLETRD